MGPAAGSTSRAATGPAAGWRAAAAVRRAAAPALYFIPGVVAAVVAVILLLSALLDDITSPEASPDATGAIAAPPATAAPATETPEPAPAPPGFGDGTYLVGNDVQPGTYHTTGGSGCNWQRLSDVSGDYDAVLAWEWPDGQAYVEILPTDRAFTTEDCGTWSRNG